MKNPDYTDIIEAHKRISDKIHNTPVISSELINKIAGCKILFKCENFQKVGAFKFRGATNAVLSLNDKQKEFGVCTHSSGNHAQALSLAAKNEGIPAYIVMPETAPKVKIRAVKNYDAEIFFCKPNLAAREKKLKEIQKKTNASFVHPYDNPLVIAGQATAAKELLEEYPALEIITAPIGGGGLMSGTALSANYLQPKIKIIGAEPEKADDAYRSFYRKMLIPSDNPQTIADGLLTSLSDRTFDILLKNLNEILTCSEQNIIKAMRLIYERLKIVVEPSGAVPLAVILQHPEYFKDKTCGVIISGGNVDISKLSYYF